MRKISKLDGRVVFDIMSVDSIFLLVLFLETLKHPQKFKKKYPLQSFQATFCFFLDSWYEVFADFVVKFSKIEFDWMGFKKKKQFSILQTLNEILFIRNIIWWKHSYLDHNTLHHINILFWCSIKFRLWWFE